MRRGDQRESSYKFGYCCLDLAGLAWIEIVEVKGFYGGLYEPGAAALADLLLPI